MVRLLASAEGRSEVALWERNKTSLACGDLTLAIFAVLAAWYFALFRADGRWQLLADHLIACWRAAGSSVTALQRQTAFYRLSSDGTPSDDAIRNRS